MAGEMIGHPTPWRVMEVGSTRREAGGGQLKGRCHDTRLPLIIELSRGKPVRQTSDFGRLSSFRRTNYVRRFSHVVDRPPNFPTLGLTSSSRNRALRMSEPPPPQEETTVSH